MRESKKSEGERAFKAPPPPDRIVISASIELDDNTLAFTDYLEDSTEHHFNFSKVTENKIVVIISNLKSKNSFGKDEIFNKRLKSI